jgi:hypothetical protein
MRQAFECDGRTVRQAPFEDKFDAMMALKRFLFVVVGI